jgi:ATP-dependent Clp protease, protease subunit
MPREFESAVRWRSASIPVLALVGVMGLALPVSVAIGDDRAAEPATEAEESPKVAKEKTEAERLQEEAKLITARISLMEAQQRERLLQMELEKQRISAEASLREAKQQEELASVKAELSRLTTEASVREARLADQLSQMNARLKELQVSQQIADAERRTGTQDLYTEADRLRAENAMLEARVAGLGLRTQESQAVAAAATTGITAEMNLRKAKDQAAGVVLPDLAYAEDPFRDGVLHVSDRRIALNDAIISGTADWVVRRIDYFNNQSHELPIFIVIDSCPGGSVMEGYRIVNAVQNSPAPIYVVVKSYAASMAAVITTLADRSFAMPNAIILHHQMSTGTGGNLTEIKEQYENAIEWSRRLHEPVCQKLGLTYEEFVRQMYANNSAGDWEEFADRAKELKWVGEIVTEVREASVRSRPDDVAPRPWWFFFASSSNRYEPASAQDSTNALSVIQRDEKGQPFIQLPPLRPFDHYFMHNPGNFYRY